MLKNKKRRSGTSKVPFKFMRINRSLIFIEKINSGLMTVVGFGVMTYLSSLENIGPSGS